MTSDPSISPNICARHRECKWRLNRTSVDAAGVGPAILPHMRKASFNCRWNLFAR